MVKLKLTWMKFHCFRFCCWRETRLAKVEWTRNVWMFSFQTRPLLNMFPVTCCFSFPGVGQERWCFSLLQVVESPRIKGRFGGIRAWKVDRRKPLGNEGMVTLGMPRTVNTSIFKIKLSGHPCETTSFSSNSDYCRTICLFVLHQAWKYWSCPLCV